MDKDIVVGIHIDRAEDENICPKQPLSKYMVLSERMFQLEEMLRGTKVQRKALVVTSSEKVRHELLD